MPLPKSASIAARATEVYSETWSVVLQKCWGVPPVMEDELADIYQLLPYLRQLLTCCACAGLLEDAMISLVCGHCYCYECQFRTPLLKIQCRQCRERRGLVIEAQLRLLVDCYKKMCLILASQLDNNPLVLSVERSDPSNYFGSSDSEKETLKGVSDRETSEAQVRSSTAIIEGFNPITEILKEVQEGTKVSRAVLVVKPPSKYMNAKLMATPKKETPSSTLAAKVTTSSLTTDKPEKEAENKSPLEVEPAAGEESSKKKRSHKAKRKLSLNAAIGKKESSNENQKTPKEVTKGRRKEDSSPTPSTKAAIVTHYDLTKAKLAVDNLRPVQLEVSLKSLDNHVVKVTSNRISIKDTLDKNGKKGEGYSNPTVLKYVRFQLDKEGNRKRAWDPLCPRVVVKRSRASIDKMRNLQTRTVGAKLRSKERKKKTNTPPLDPPTAVVKASKKTRQAEPPLPRPPEKEEVDHIKTLQQLEREHGLELPDIDTDIDPDLELDASWLEQLCEGIDEEDLMYFSQPPIPGPLPHPHSHPPMPFPPSPTPPHHAPMFGPPYSPRPHLSPHPHHFSPHHPPPPGFMHPLLGPPPPPHHFMPQHHPLPPPIHHPPRPHPLPPNHPPPPIRIHPPTSPQSPVFPSRSKHQLPVIVGKLNVGKSSGYTPPAKLSTGQSSKAKKRRSPGYSESGWRCRCGTNNVMFPEKVCAKGKCPCFSKGIPCKNCLCRHCHNPFNNSEGEETEESEQTADETENMDDVVV